MKDIKCPCCGELVTCLACVEVEAGALSQGEAFSLDNAKLGVKRARALSRRFGSAQSFHRLSHLHFTTSADVLKATNEGALIECAQGIAEMERENIRERQAAGIALAKKRGVYSGRRRGTTKGNPERARELESKGFEPEEIARALGVSTRTANRYLTLQT